MNEYNEKLHNCTTCLHLDHFECPSPHFYCETNPECPINGSEIPYEPICCSFYQNIAGTIMEEFAETYKSVYQNTNDSQVQPITIGDRVPFLPDGDITESPAGIALKEWGEAYKSAVGDTTKDTNLKNDDGKIRLDLIPTSCDRALGEVLTHGASEYKENTWQILNNAQQRYLGALRRHLLDYIDDPYGVDKKSGLPHIAHVLCNAMFLNHFVYLERKNDDNGER